MADLPPIIVLALGGAAVGGPEAIALLLECAAAGRNPPAAFAIAVFLGAGAVAALVLGTVLQAFHVRAVANEDDGGAAGTARLARATLAVALAVAVLVAACLLAVVPSAAGQPCGAAGSRSA